ncbi:MAG: FAD-binding oxidoreductase [Bacteroidetes bacterium]|nr:FAD-binding oxidoreductase [Bacteroidota bacterium]MBU1115933.1 FAD-binding oxidoreductase [Bacteroidota bacterium]MBU1798470.1 FAD-binding oxidoreductase [Bacteroidota bacterium]
MKSKIYSKLASEFEKRIPAKRIFMDELNRLAYGTDASFYRMLPEIVIKVQNSEEVQFVVQKCKEANVPVTFRAAGTSLSGQAISDSVLMVADRSWRGHKISNDKQFISLEPSVIGSFANAYLKKYDKKIGPDPASIDAAMIGGIAANNASGMCCGTAQNSYNTLESMKIIFHDGTLLDTGNEESIASFKKSHTSLIDNIIELHKEINSDAELSSLIRHKYKMKNTTGYSLNSLVDFSDPIQIIQHLMIGSEGTLGFISEITYRTVLEAPNKASALILFENLRDACKAVFTLKKQAVDAVEIMDRAALRSVEDKAGMPEYLKTLANNVTALLIETSSVDKESLQKQMAEITESINEYNLVLPVAFTDVPSEYSKLWKIRKGLFPSVGAMRETGTTCIIEDVAFPLDKLADAALELQSLFAKYHYDEAIIFGHSLEGNLHFVFNQDFNIESEVRRYKNFMDEVILMTAGKYKGSLKAEHGTGRNMAPFVKYEWGEKAYSMMQEIKKIFDPENILNPGVILNNDENIHLKNLKPLPAARDIIDKCIECGFCENSCPSRDLTLTPRQRIATYREIANLTRNKKDVHRKNELIESFKYYGEETCATDGLCAISCPVGIDTGKLIKQLRADDISPTGNTVAKVLANRLSLVLSVMKIGLNVVHFWHIILGTPTIEYLAKTKKKIFGKNFPLWNKWMPKAADKLLPEVNSFENEKKVVYFPSCISRSMGNPKGSKTNESLTTVTHRLLLKAGYDIIYPKDLDNLCCGMPWLSKGYNEQGNEKTDELINRLNEVSENGKYPVLYDTSPCLQTTKNRIESKGGNSLKIYEPVEFISDYLLEALEIEKQEKTITVHVTCSSTKMGLTDKFIKVAKACATDVIVPENVTCCGFAGDRGFNFPELNESALKDLKPQLTESCHEGYSNSKTCEIGLSYNSGIEYRSIIYLVDECCK